ncbi:MAG: hypothetical protein HFJ84_11045 [Clostridiales bacterium]|jgi:hypothetical protein|nr:hypothetical protein [Clostridiales bacterium]
MEDFPWFKVLASILVPIIVAFIPLLYNYFHRKSQGNEERMEWILKEVLYPIMNLKDKFFHESMIEIEEIQKFFREWKHLLERNPRKIPDFYGKRIRKLEGYLECYLVKSEESRKFIELKMKKYLNQDCKKIFWFVEREINRYHKQLGYLYSSIWKEICFYSGSGRRVFINVILPALACIGLFISYWILDSFLWSSIALVLFYICFSGFMIIVLRISQSGNRYERVMKKSNEKE